MSKLPTKVITTFCNESTISFEHSSHVKNQNDFISTFTRLTATKLVKPPPTKSLYPLIAWLHEVILQTKSNLSPASPVLWPTNLISYWFIVLSHSLLTLVKNSSRDKPKWFFSEILQGLWLLNLKARWLLMKSYYPQIHITLWSPSRIRSQDK